MYVVKWLGLFMSRSASEIAEFIAQASYNVWVSSEFRKIISFDSLSQIEQDRIFNEIEVTLLGVVMLKAEEHLKPQVAYTVAQAFLDILSKVNLQTKYVDGWRQLIALRFDEYKKDYEIALKESESIKDFEKEDEKIKNAWARIETLTIDSLSHIRRGKVRKNDPLWSFLRIWLAAIDVTLGKSLVSLGLSKTKQN